MALAKAWSWQIIFAAEGCKASAEPLLSCILLHTGSLAERRERVGLRPGQLDPRTAEIGHRMQELAGRRMYLRNFWYAAGEQQQPSTPQLLRLH